MIYKSVNYFAMKWNLNERRVRLLCEEGRIAGAIKIGRNWSIPEDAVKPVDLRLKQSDIFSGVNKEFENCDSLKEIIDSYRPFSKNLSIQLKDALIVDWTYNTNAIEGNTLTISETKIVLEEGMTIGGKSLKEHLEAINHKEAILFLEELVEKNSELTEYSIKCIHALILKNIDNENAGKYRNENVIISGATHIPPSHLIVQEKMAKLISDYQKKWDKLHPIVIASLLHGEFVKIHPFIDGNGRTARLLLNFILMKCGYPAIIIKKENRLEYYGALDVAHVHGDYNAFINLISKLVLEREKLYISLLA